MDIIRQVLKSADVGIIIIGLLLIICAIVVGVFKQYWLIAGVNTSQKKELEKIDLEYVGKYFGLFLGIFGLFIVLIPFIFILLNIKDIYPGLILGGGTIVFVVFMFLYGHFKKDRIYKKNYRDD